MADTESPAETVGVNLKSWSALSSTRAVASCTTDKHWAVNQVLSEPLIFDLFSYDGGSLRRGTEGGPTFATRSGQIIGVAVLAAAPYLFICQSRRQTIDRY